MMQELHIVIGRNGFVPEQDGNQSFNAIVADIISGQHGDIARVLRLVPPARGWPACSAIEDVTSKVAAAIHARCDGDRTWISYDGPAYAMVEYYIGIAQARTCLDGHGEGA